MSFFPRAEEKNLTLLEHLDELRFRLVRAVLAFVLGCIGGYFLAGPANELLVQPFRDANPGANSGYQGLATVVMSPDGSLRLENPSALLDEKVSELKLRRVELVDEATSRPLASLETGTGGGLIFLKPLDPMMIRLRTMAILGFLASFPYILYQLFVFIAPGLHTHERRTLAPMIVLAGLLFPAGAWFAYATMEYAILFLAQYGFGDVLFMNDARSYLSFALTTLVACGVVFELPVLVLLAVRTGLVSVETLAARRKHVLVGVLVVAAILTPPDPVTMFALGVPLYGLFEFSLLLGRMTGSVARPTDSDPDAV